MIPEREKERHLLLVEDNAGDALLLQEYLDEVDGGQFRVSVADTLAAAECHLARNGADAIILDLNLPDSSGRNTVEWLREQSAEAPIIVLTGLEDAQIGLEAVRRGAQDYLIKGELNSRILLKALHYAEERHHLRRQSEADRQRLAENEQRFRTVAQENADGIVVVNGDGNIRFVNPAAETLFGQTAADLCGQPFGHPLNPADQTEIALWQSDGSTRSVEMRTAKTTWEGENSFLISLRDISERRQMERELRESQELFAKAFHASPTAMGITSLATDHIIDANERALNLFGYRREEVIGRTAQELDLWVQAEYREKVRRAFAEEGGVREVELQARTKSGAIRDVLVTFERVDLQHEPVVLSIIEDITERKRAEAARQRALERLKILHEIDSAILSAESIEQIASRALKEVIALLGLDQGGIALFDFPGGSFRLLTASVGNHPPANDDKGKAFPLSAFRGDLAALQAGKIEIVQDIAQREEEEERFHLMRRQALRSFVSAPLLIDGNLLGALNLASAAPGAITGEHAEVAREVANQLAIALREERLIRQTRRQAQQLKEIIDAVPEGILLLDGDDRILSANRGATALLADFIDFDGNAQLTHLGNELLRPLLKPTDPGAPWHELRLEAEQRILELGVSTMSLPDQQTGWVLVVRDVTQQRQQEQYLQTQDRLAAVGQLAAGIAHDFNNVMAIITLYSESLLRDDGHPKKEHFLTTISEQARHASDLIGQILDFSRHAVMKRKPLDLRPFVKEMVRLFERTLPENITINLTTGKEDTVVEADPTRLQQALMNLAVNARDAMPDGGKLELALDYLTVGPEEEPPLPEMATGKWVTLTIRDTGEGMAAEVASHLFEPFFTTKERGKGTGLGLAQVYGIIKQHEGEIAVQTELGRGTAFTIYLPADVPSSAPPAQTTKDGEWIEPVGAGETILVVEDNDVVREAMIAVLHERNFQVLEAADGVEGLRLFEEYAPAIDLVITDVVMPNMGGADLHERLQQLQPDLKLIVMTGYPRDEAGRALIDDGRVCWIEKPFAAERLVAAVQDALGKTSEESGGDP